MAFNCLSRFITAHSSFQTSYSWLIFKLVWVTPIISRIYINMFLCLCMFANESYFFFCLIPAHLKIQFMCHLLCQVFLEPARKYPFLSSHSILVLGTYCAGIICWLAFPTSLWSAHRLGTMSYYDMVLIFYFSYSNIDFAYKKESM